MNLLKSALNLNKSQPVHGTLLKIYESVKRWDQQRTKSLGNNIHIVQLVMDRLDMRVSQVDKYIKGLQKLMTLRLEQITVYCKNGVNDSEFFVVPTPLNSLKPSHQILKQLLMQESLREQNLAKKASVLSLILDKLHKLKAIQCSQSDESCDGEGASVRELKSNIRFLIDCELPDLFASVQNACKQVSSSLPQEKDLYWAVQKFVKSTEKQLKKHQEIGVELCNLSQMLASRQKRLRKELKQILLEWVREELEDKVFEEQLSKNERDQVIDEYYNIENQMPEQAALWKGGSLVEYLRKFDIASIKDHEKLIVYSRQVFYNAKVQTKVVLTQQKYAYLFRPHKFEPDFKFVLGKSIRVKSRGGWDLQIAQWKSSILLMEQIEFKFVLQFVSETDLKDFLYNLKTAGCQMQS